ncbi:hypothetical protein [Burkholderia ubonensis]|uniref:hypothetical protein n=1 Tax=Burkholderia ubonensis TaxID=101571 RepID=UPI0009B3DFC2|nr:hypothetical protein [Burkholderia ubonensis]
MRTGASREIRAAGYNLKAGTIRKTLSATRATPARLIAALTATGRPIPLINYGARQTTKGVTVRVKNGSKTLRHAFIATMASGHIGVFERVGTGHKRVTRNGRAYWSGLPIRELYGRIDSRCARQRGCTEDHGPIDRRPLSDHFGA